MQLDIRRWGIVLGAGLAILCATTEAGNSTATTTSGCSATAIQAWKAKCPSRTTGNKDFLPLTDMAAGDINIDDTTLVDTYNQARLNALKLSGAVGNAAMAGMRKKNRGWYEQSLRKIFTFFCAEVSDSSELHRCVAPSSPYAEKDITGACVVVGGDGNCASKGMCERESNCKWDDAIAGAMSRRELFSDANITTAKKWLEKDYPSTFAPFIAPGIVFAVIVALSCVGFVVLRCVFNQCGGRNPREKGYTRCDILTPSVIFVVCSAAVFICSFITIAQNTNISEGVRGVLNSLNVTLENIDIFANNVRAPLALADQQLLSAKVTVATQMKELDWIATDSAKLNQMLTDFRTMYESQGPFPFKTCDPQTTSCVKCLDAVCGSPLKAFVSNAQAALDVSGGAIAKSVSTMQDTFVKKSDNISKSIRKATLEISEMANLTKSSKEVVDVIKTTFDAYSFSRSALVLSVFMFAVVASLVGLFAIIKGVCKRKSGWVHLLHISWSVSVLVCILGFVLSASLLAVGALWFDSCNYMNILHTDLTPYFPTRVSSIVNACFQDTGVLAPLGLESALSFQCELDDNYASVSKADFSAVQKLISSYGRTVGDFGLRDFGFDSTMSRDLVSKANAAVKEADRPGKELFTKENIVKPWEAYQEDASMAKCPNDNAAADERPVCYMNAKCASGTGPVSTKDKCKEAFAGAYYYTLAFNKISNMLDEMRETLLGDTGVGFPTGWKHDVSIAEFATSYFTRLSTVKTATIDQLMKGEVGKVMETIERVRCTESCGWLNISFNAVHDSMCKDILGTTLAISLCVLFLSLFLIPMIFTGITLQKRLRGAKKGTYEELEKRLQQLEVKQREEARAKASSKKGIELFKFKRNLDSA